MKKNDFLLILIIALLVSPFFINSIIFDAYIAFNATHGMITSFLKFGILATFGEILALRIKDGVYIKKDFGILPKFIVWGIIGLSIKFAFIVFATGVPIFIEYMGINDATKVLHDPFSAKKLFVAFAVSFSMNIIYAPVMMLSHKISDIHISNHKGKLNSLVKSSPMAQILNSIDWSIQWGFIFKKTIPLFWIPAHTFTFLLAPDFQVLFAAILSVLLGLILSAATLKSRK